MLEKLRKELNLRDKKRIKEEKNQVSLLNNNFKYFFKNKYYLGLPALPTDTFEADFKANCKKLFDEIEERKLHYMRL